MSSLPIQRWRNTNVNPKQFLRTHGQRLPLEMEHEFVTSALHLIAERTSVSEEEMRVMLSSSQISMSDSEPVNKQVAARANRPIGYTDRTGAPEGVQREFIALILAFPERIYGTWGCLHQDGTTIRTQGWYIWIESLQLLGVSCGEHCAWRTVDKVGLTPADTQRRAQEAFDYCVAMATFMACTEHIRGDEADLLMLRQCRNACAMEVVRCHPAHAQTSR